MKPPVQAPTSRQTRSRGSTRERVEGPGQLLAAARHVRRRLVQADRHVTGHEVARFAVATGTVTVPDAHAPGQQEGLRLGPARDEAAGDDELVQPGASRHAG